MFNASTRSALALAICGALYAGSADAALQLSDAFDGSYNRAGQGGRGMLVDVTKLNDGRVIAGLAIYTFDAEGNPLWLTVTPVMGEFQYSAQNVPINAFSGGNFGNPFEAPTGSVVGTANITFNHCRSVTVELNMDAASGLPNTTHEWAPVAALNNCVYSKAFTGCPDFSTPVPSYGDRACQIQGDFLNRDITLTNEITWVLEGKVGIGGDNANQSTLRIEPGTLIVGSGDTFDHLAVNRGSKIYAEGKRHAPIILTSPFELPGFDGEPNGTDIGGFVISGNAPSNCNPNCVAEWDPTNRYGGDDPNDNSGIVRFMQVRYAGYIFTTNRELNSFTLNGVGAGTTLEYLQAYKGADDGIEFFGGTANVRYFVDTCGGDDSIDWDEGYSGKMQYALVQQRGCSGQDHGFEVSNSPTNFDATPRSRPTIANVTLLGGGTGSRDAFNLKEGTGGNFFNIVAQNFARSCVAVEGTPTEAAAGPANALTGVLTMQNTVIDCTTNFRTSGGVSDGYAQAWFNAQPGNAAAPLALNGFMPTSASPVFGKPFNPGNNHWFEPTDYAGAFRSNRREDNWTLGWTHDAQLEITGAYDQ